jgi:cyclomaltodextrinase
MTVPYWVKDAIFYQIFPDRFANGDPTNDPPNVQKWGTLPTINGFQGGDLRGILQRFDYLLELGVNALYLNPLFLSSSPHRYNTFDYYRIDPKLGDILDFHALIDLAHRNNVHVILDGVFNHCGRGFFAFVDVLENGDHSPYKDWFHIYHLPLDAYGHGEAKHYATWWNFKSLPKFNTGNPQVREYLMGVARHWIEQGADGWRLDVPNEIDDDDFWAEFRHVVKTANRDAYLLGEIWTADQRWANDTHCDGLMDYPVREGLLACLTGKETVVQFADKVENLLAFYPRDNVYAMYIPLGSHDTERVASLLGNDLAKIKLAFMFQFAYPGAPAIYYGDEVGLEGGRDPDCRRAFPWDPAQWKGDLQAWVRDLVAARKARPSLRHGEFSRLFVDEEQGLYAFARTLGEEKTVVILNVSDKERSSHIHVKPLNWSDGQSVRSILDNRPFTVAGGQCAVTLNPWSGLWIG